MHCCGVQCTVYLYSVQYLQHKQQSARLNSECLTWSQSLFLSGLRIRTNRTNIASFHSCYSRPLRCHHTRPIEDITTLLRPRCLVLQQWRCTHCAAVLPFRGERSTSVVGVSDPDHRRLTPFIHLSTRSPGSMMLYTFFESCCSMFALSRYLMKC